MSFRKRTMRPRRRLPYRPRRRTTVRRYRRTTRRAGTSRKTPSIVPNALTTRLRYGEYYNFSTGAATYYTKTYRLNGLYDAEAATGGGTCTGFDELALLYGRYRVLGAKITVWFYSTCATALMCGIHARSSSVSSALTSGVAYQQVALERPDVCRHRKLVPYGSGTSYPVAKVSMYKSVRSLEGRGAGTDEDYTALCNATPARECSFDVFLCSLDGATTNVTANAAVDITYYVQFSGKVLTYTD